MIPACGSDVMSSGPGLSGSGAVNSIGNSTGGNNGTPGAGGSVASIPGSGSGGDAGATSTDCPAGAERCACYGNGTCNAGLVCASQHCVNITGLVGGSSGGTSANGSGGSTTNNSGTNTIATATGGSPSSISTGGTSTGGANATGGRIATTGGALATGGSVATGGARATGGTLGTGGVSFWKTVTYSATGLPNPSNGNHNPGQNCIQCHVSGTSTEAPPWLFGGTVYKADGTTPAPNVQVGVNDGTNLYTAYSATNGNFWFGGSGTINWAAAQVRIRNANGELMMAGATAAATCNLCHNSTTYPRITAP